jgi:heptosyltransferase II
MNQHRFLLLHHISLSRPQSYTLNYGVGSVSLTLAQRVPGNIIVIGSPEEIVKFRIESKSKQNEKRILFLPADMSIMDVTAVLARCSLLLCNDGGLMHVAAAVDVPIVSLWGPTNPRRSGYLFKNNFRVIKSSSCEPCREDKKRAFRCQFSECLEEITVDEVLHQCKLALKIENLPPRKV